MAETEIQRGDRVRVTVEHQVPGTPLTLPKGAIGTVVEAAGGMIDVLFDGNPTGYQYGPDHWWTTHLSYYEVIVDEQQA
jgi:hypothetical protein